eukprot:527324-Pyramimonas_sp.AAC.1
MATCAEGAKCKTNEITESGEARAQCQFTVWGNAKCEFTFRDKEKERMNAHFGMLYGHLDERGQKVNPHLGKKGKRELTYWKQGQCEFTCWENRGAHSTFVLQVQWPRCLGLSPRLPPIGREAALCRVRRLRA